LIVARALCKKAVFSCMFLCASMLLIGSETGFAASITDAGVRFADATQQATPASDRSRFPAAAAVEIVVRDQMARRRIPGLQVAIVQRGKLVFSGLLDRPPLRVDCRHRGDCFSLNSSTKSFTGVAVMQLVEDSKLSLEKPISTYLTDLPETWRPVTVMQLLTHCSGSQTSSFNEGSRHGDACRRRRRSICVEQGQDLAHAVRAWNSIPIQPNQLRASRQDYRPGCRNAI
jgi:CubicO group peptidase (beta-lactamase class C family)